MSRSERISPDEREQPAGWPRPHYLGNDGKPRYTQWISDHAEDQIFSCDSNRTYTAGTLFACSSCAQVMQRGLIVDVTMDCTPRINEYDVAFGSPLCHRCAVFALHHCPHFAELSRRSGVPDSGISWVEVLSAADYEEYDETSALRLTGQGKLRRRVSHAEVMACVQHGWLYLTSESAAAMNQLTRPPDYTFD